MLWKKLKIPGEQISVKNTPTGLSFFADNWTVITTVIFMVGVVMIGVYFTSDSEDSDYKQILEEVAEAKKKESAAFWDEVALRSKNYYDFMASYKKEFKQLKNTEENVNNVKSLLDKDPSNISLRENLSNNFSSWKYHKKAVEIKKNMVPEECEKIYDLKDLYSSIQPEPPVNFLLSEDQLNIYMKFFKNDYGSDGYLDLLALFSHLFG